MKNLLFLCISLGIFIFSIIILNIAPSINKVSPDLFLWDYWSNYACKSLSDEYNNIKNTLNKNEKEEKTKSINRCNRKQAMIKMEYVTSNLNIIIGFICSLLGFLIYKNIGNIGNDVKYIVLIGLICAVVGFVLTLVYVIESGLVFNDIAFPGEIKIDSDGAVLKLNENKYTCIFYDKDNKDTLNLKYSEFGNKYLRYMKKMYYPNEEKEYKYNSDSEGCRISSFSYFLPPNMEYNYNNIYDFCVALENGVIRTYIGERKYFDTSNPNNSKGTCDKLFFFKSTYNNDHKILYDSWLTTIILSCFIMLLYIGLVIFGFLLFNSSISLNHSSVVIIKQNTN